MKNLLLFFAIILSVKSYSQKDSVDHYFFLFESFNYATLEEDPNMVYDTVAHVKDYINIANSGNAYVQVVLGQCYECGIVVEQDYKKSFGWYMKAAKSGNADAQNNVGLCYELGQGIKKDYSKAVKWYLKSAKQNYVDAIYNLSVCYREGIGVEKNRERSEEYLNMIPKDYYHNSNYYYGINLVYRFGTLYPLSKAIKFLKREGELGNIVALQNLAYCYDYGFGVKEDNTEMIKCYIKAAELGDVDAQEYLDSIEP